MPVVAALGLSASGPARPPEAQATANSVARSERVVAARRTSIPFGKARLCADVKLATNLQHHTTNQRDGQCTEQIEAQPVSRHLCHRYAIRSEYDRIRDRSHG